ncbi:DeoR family transcriptional regulator [Alteromonas sp. 76-1]|nr:DeoR family transcriptional regulator [Alteromonas sp. 76-1]
MVRTTGNSSLKRRLQMLDVIRQQNEVKVEALSQQFNVSTVTIRGDLNYLEEQGFIVRSFGSAKYSPDANSSLPSSTVDNTKLNISNADGLTIAKLAAGFVENGESLFLGASDLTHKMVPFLASYESLSLIVNTLEIVPTVKQFMLCDLQLLGGTVSEECSALVGPIAEQGVHLQLVSKCFIEFAGVNADGYLTLKNVAMARLYKDIVNHSEMVIALIPHAVFSDTEGYPVCKLSELDILILTCDIGEDETSIVEQAAMSVTQTRGNYQILSK